MLRNLILLGVLVGTSVSVPMIYQGNPEAFHRLLGGTPASNDNPAPEATVLRSSSASPRADTPSGRKVRLQADPRGHFNADFRLNGRVVEAMVDTGASVVAINETTARRIGLKLTQQDFVHEVQTANGKAKAAGAVIDRISIGRVEARNVQAVVLEDRALSGTLVGMSFLNQLRRYHVAGGEMVMEQ